ncbi:hypothetical protein DFH09DRAFT_1312643 [Mycena vulgaris]|nr:hypothetical protein DFH09DRAFT_1312643 [Mycena vulgaris]
MKFTISLLALCSAACALSVAQSFPPANVAKVIDVAAYMAGDDTGVQDKRALGTVFLCNAAFFSGYCVGITGGFDGGCIDLGVDLDNQVSSFGPDAGQHCQLYDSHGCVDTGAGSFTLPISFPGVQDLSQSFSTDFGVSPPFNDRASSYKCVFH